MPFFKNNTERPIYAAGVTLIPGGKKNEKGVVVGDEITDKAILESPRFKRMISEKDIEEVKTVAPKKLTK